jgi:coenzyme PQQ precursor peptide PqqA
MLAASGTGANECRALFLLSRGKEMKKTWKKPKVVEIAVGMEINSYACAELKK